MKRILGILAVLTLGAGCSSGPSAPVAISPANPSPAITQTNTPPTSRTTIAAPDNSPTVATVAGNPITRDELTNLLIKAHGLNTLLELVQLEVAKQAAREVHAVVSPADIESEYDLSLRALVPDVTKDDYPAVIQQLLTSQHLTRADFDLWIETNAYLRKAAEPEAAKWVTEDRLHEAFGQLYGEQVQVRHIQFSTPAKAETIKQRLAGGESFAQVAEEMSENDRTAKLGGELSPFTRSNPNFPESFKEAAFALKEGEVSQIVSAAGSYHLILLEKRIAPKVVKFEDERDSLRHDLIGKATQAQMQDLRDKAKDRARQMLVILDPELKKQYNEQILAAELKAKEDDKAAMTRDLEAKIKAAQQLKAQEGAPATAPAARPPATQSVSPPLPDTSAPSK